MKMAKSIRRLYFALSAAIVLLVPSLIMYGEDGNLLIRVALMAALTIILYLIYKILSSHTE